MQATGLVAVVVTYNRLEKLKVTVARLLAQGDALAQCVVFDNASDDGTQDWLASLDDPRIVIEQSAKNLGGAGGFAAAIKLTHERLDPDWMVLMDDDARPIADTFSSFIKQDRTAAAAWAARVVYPDGTPCDMNRPWVNPFASLPVLVRTLFRGRNGFHIDDAITAQRPIDGGSFVGLFLSREAIKTGGYPDADLFLYGDDVLYTLGLTRAGMALRYDPALTFEHDCETLDADAIMSPLWKVYFYHRNQVSVYRAAAGPILFWPLLVMRLILWRRRAGRYGADRSRYKMLLRLAVRDGLRGDRSRKRTDIEALLSGN